MLRQRLGAQFVVGRAGVKERVARGRTVDGRLDRRIEIGAGIFARSLRVRGLEAAMAGACHRASDDRDKKRRSCGAHQRSARGSTLARRAEESAAVAPTLNSPKRSESVEPINVPPAKYVPESESGRMSYVNGWS